MELYTPKNDLHKLVLKMTYFDILCDFERTQHERTILGTYYENIAIFHRVPFTVQYTLTPFCKSASICI